VTVQIDNIIRTRVVDCSHHQVLFSSSLSSCNIFAAKFHTCAADKLCHKRDDVKEKHPNKFAFMCCTKKILKKICCHKLITVGRGISVPYLELHVDNIGVLYGKGHS
jgi:hypothetical protein